MHPMWGPLLSTLIFLMWPVDSQHWLVRNVEPQAPWGPHLLNQNLHFDRSRSDVCVLSVRGTAAWGLDVLIIPTCRCDWVLCGREVGLSLGFVLASASIRFESDPCQLNLFS